ncbi:MAG: bifunctional homocysteine S-methyltransferase/methylenetetrahydrofolate reductase [Acidobacteriota bacterium]|nr:bifunctional homocysteine S-methyltransferase/methylenetetrahydrofolate reductase [Blastocatellia bacterium]MDW8411555.1 bifunctional homocysteine S-methyltransferase/methylenetetrahydrofolate reductase [Acidobacteriota bacterium]
MPDFRRLILDERAHVFDGAMGTMLYQKGVYINRCFDELNLSDPKLVLDVHRDYVKAGAEIIETNSFGANPVKLAKHGLAEKVIEINRAAAQLAREAAGERVCVAGSIGPLGIRIEPYGPTSREEAKEYFKLQVRGLLEGGVDCFILETFSDLSEIRQALLAVRELSDLPVIAQMTIQSFGKTSFGTAPETFTAQLDQWGADVIGINCSVGPKDTFEAIQVMASITSKRLSAQPNAGLPREIDGRKLYMCSPEYMAKYARRLIQVGVKFVGGCCGTTPEHIRQIASAVKASSPASVIRVAKSVQPVSMLQQAQVVPTEKRSELARKIVCGEFVTSVEIVPPRGCDPTAMLESVKLLRSAGVDAVNIPDGPRAQSRMSAMSTAVLIMRDVPGIEPVVHYCCRDRNLLGMMSDLLGAAALGIRNLLIITGDPPKMGPYPDATAVFDVDSIGLTNMVYGLNNGTDLGGNSIGKPTAFFIGVGVNPCAVDLDYEIRRFEWKVDAGAQFAVTQPIFDIRQLERFLKRIEHCRIPIIAGIWPLVSYRNAEFLNNEVPGISIPQEILSRMKSADTQEAARQEGLLIARELLMKARPMIQGVQVSAPFGKVSYALEVLSALEK